MADRKLRPGLKLRARPRERLFGDNAVFTVGLEQSPWSDLYHNSMVVSWPRFLIALAASFVALNFVFAALYALGKAPIANARPESFSDLFFFSVETLSTTGYGDMHPQTIYGHVVATIEIFTSLVSTAAGTGLIFARFSRPRARLIFASHPVVTMHDGVETLMLRAVNARDSYISEATAKLWLLAPTVTTEGRRFTGFVPMTLAKSENPAFVLSWTLFHVLDETSPLYGRTAESLIADEARLVVSISGLDETSAQVVHARNVYRAADLRWGHEFIDMFSRDEQGNRHVDFSKVHETRLA